MTTVALPSIHRTNAVAKRKLHKDEIKSERVEFLASPAWLKRSEASAEMLGLSLAAFIRMACEEKTLRLRGKPDGT